MTIHECYRNNDLLIILFGYRVILILCFIIKSVNSQRHFYYPLVILNILITSILEIQLYYNYNLAASFKIIM